MKVLTLVLQAFGPFADRQEIDFRQLGENPLFLINGPTGAGKSSILDAICFALYGKTTTEKREASDMRCDLAAADSLTEVILDFELGQKQYRVSRTPQQERPKLKGEGVTVESGQASLWEIKNDGSLNLLVARKLQEVNQHIEQLSGLNDQQFRQVMVLPQGKFRDLLLADSRDREKIFSQLFQTSIYSRIEERLKQQASTIFKDVINLQNQIKGLLQGVEVSAETEINQQLDALNPELEQALKLKDEAHGKYQDSLLKKQSAQKVLTQFSTLEGLEVDLKSLEQQQAVIQQKQLQFKRGQLAQKLKPGFDQEQRLVKELLQLAEDVAGLQQARILAQQELQRDQNELTQASKEFAEVDQLKARKNELLQIDARLQQRLAAQQKAGQSSSASQISQQKLDNTKIELKQQEQGREKLEKELEQLRLAVGQLPARELQRQELKRQLQQLERLESLQQSHSATGLNLEGAEAKSQQMIAAASASHELAQQQELDWHNSQAISLALELRPNQPCPVCGSRSHPAPAREDHTQLLVSKQQLDDSRLKANADQTRLQQSIAQIEKLEYDLRRLEQDIQKITEELSYDGSLTTTQLNTSIQQLDKDVSSIQQQQQAIHSINENLELATTSIRELQQRLIRDQAKHDADQQQAIVDQASVNHFNNEIPQQFQQQADLSEDITRISGLIDARSEAFQVAQSQHEQTKTRLTQLETSLQDADISHELLQQKYKSAADDWQQILAASEFDNVQTFQQSLLSEDTASRLDSEINRYFDQVKEFQWRITQLKQELAGQQKPDLDILEKALLQDELAYKQADQLWNRLKARVNQLTEVLAKLDRLHQKNALLEGQYAIFGTLSDIASGKTANNVSLQRYVLSVLLDDVLIQATQRLHIMSKGRYLLLRKDQRSKGRGAFGLDLDVEDAYTGKTRSVSTLSGGESFMAALSLALGLSDVVQAYAGGINLDMLFIDEGFGSLDQESLDLAIRTLMDLQASGRMIGIISHVSELKEQMTLRLDVESTRSGSRVKLIAG